jgi:DUF971 family protein
MSNIAELILHKRSKTLELVLNTGAHHTLTAEFLRVHSPSAEVRGHGKPSLQTGKKFVGITQVTPIGRYGIKITFDDGHDTGLYTWQYLIDLAQSASELWANYLAALQDVGASRDPDETVVKWAPPRRQENQKKRGD